MSGLVCVECGEAFLDEDLILLKDEYVCATCKPIFLQKVEEGISVSSREHGSPAGFWIRTGAYFLDAVIMLPITAISIFNMMQLKSMIIMIIICVIGMAYRPVLHGLYGATLGKMAFKIWVRKEDGSSITMAQAWLRSLLFTLAGILGLISTTLIFLSDGFEDSFGFIKWSQFVQENTNPTLSIVTNVLGVVVFIAMVMVAFTDRKRGLHDMIGKTYCIYKTS